MGKFKKTGEGRYVSQCLFHEDKTPRAGITQKPDGVILIHCFSCGAGGLDFCNALGIDPANLFPPSDNPKYEKRSRSSFSAWQMLHFLRSDLIRLLIIANDLKKLDALSSDDRQFVSEIILRLNDGLAYLEGAR
ncbi:MAG: hypothetical protein K2Y09_10850 [Nitrosomonas sp.]|uniref:CHC2 zinc finger domain-containing protein n=1 Tax=Nitrosomonas sp. TaxID=42353 RepID=UPI001DD56FB6|nr:CHC2 zinc finger domain-containing protein [Nitrosomonas sp.]MBX9895659.1 hypothetical protein [Nitrosomonas sp.]